jgi:hypothetical protein
LKGKARVAALQRALEESSGAAAPWRGRRGTWEFGNKTEAGALERTQPAPGLDVAAEKNPPQPRDGAAAGCDAAGGR